MDDTRMMILELGSKGYSCAQIVVTGGLRLLGRDNPDLVRAMAGLGQGVGCSGEICGALSGGVCLIAMHTAKGMDSEDTLPECQPLMNGLVEWFREEQCQGGPLTCDALLGAGGAASGTMNPQICGNLVAAVWTRAVNMLLEQGIDPVQGRELP